MPLQTDDLVLSALGIRGDVPPPHTVQPPLRDGVHLRWAFPRERGFPWYGYYLFRRKSVGLEYRRCIAADIADLATAAPTTRHVSQTGRLISDQAITIVDRIPGPVQGVATPEIDLQNRSVLRFETPIGEPAWNVSYAIGFTTPKTERVCFDLSKETRPRWTIDVPAPATLAEVTFTSGEGAVKVSALDASGAVIAKSEGPAKTSLTVSLSAKAIVRVIIDGEASVSRLCYTRTPAAPSVTIRVFDGGTLLDESLVQPPPGSSTAEGARSFDRITAFEISGGPASLISLCYAPVSGGVLSGWEILPKCPEPITLPVFSADYPCVGKPSSLLNARATALNRIVYDVANPVYGAAFPQMHDELLALVAGGPSAGLMSDREIAFPASASSTGESPIMPRQSPLDLCLLAALHPPIAQMLGIYWLDATVAGDSVYDYLLVSDRDGVLPRNPPDVLPWLLTNSFASVDAWITFAKAMAPQPPIAVPTDVRSYALPGGTLRSSTGSVSDASNGAGLNWTGGRESVLFHIWRANLGDPTPTVAAPFTAYNLVTTHGPVLPTRSFALPEQITPPPEWPPFRNDAVDRGLGDGWYSYYVNGIDLFGRHSPVSAPASWWQWAPRPDPPPWYYNGAGSDAIVHNFAIRLLDKIPPPPPSVVAWLLDPEDPYVLRDSAYTVWRASLSAADRDTLLGLRVRWEWPDSLARQAPDTREFRVYFNPGSAPPLPNAAEPTNWSARIQVVAYGATTAIDTGSGTPTRIYEVFRPAPAGLVPSLANPILYACVGVSAADDKQHTLDSPHWNGTPFGGRSGNEGAVSTPAKIFRVLREKPPQPVAAPDSERVYASPADYHARSYYTYRWVPSPHLKAHICRALDDSLFAADRAARPHTASLATTSPVFPAETRWNEATRQQVCDALNALDGMTPDARTAAYRTLSNDALRILASLPENAAAFSQITTTPLDPDDPANANRVGPDNPDSFPIDSSLRAFIDTLDGRATNRFFYRYVYVDGAQNRSDLSIASAPVWLPNVLPPASPSVRGIRGSDRQIELVWASNREEDLAEYRVYRSESEDEARDIRGMRQVVVIAAEPDPAVRPVEVSYSDFVPDGTPFWYCIVAVDTAGNVSAPTPAFDASAFRSDNPPAPDWSGAAWILSPAPHVRLEWTLLEPDLSVLVQRRDSGNGTWRAVSPWLAAGLLSFEDMTADPSRDYVYRLRARDFGGRLNRDFVQRMVGHP